MESVLIGIMIAFVLKLIDNALSALKSILMIKERYVLASLSAGIGTFFYLIAVVRITRSNDMAGMIAMCVATAVGNYIPCKLFQKVEKDKQYVYEITSDTFNNGIKFADALRKANFAVRTSIVYDEDITKTLLCKVFCDTKEESKKIVSLIQPQFKWHAYSSVQQRIDMSSER